APPRHPIRIGSEVRDSLRDRIYRSPQRVRHAHRRDVIIERLADLLSAGNDAVDADESVREFLQVRWHREQNAGASLLENLPETSELDRVSTALLRPEHHGLAIKVLTVPPRPAEHAAVRYHERVEPPKLELLPSLEVPARP